MSSRFLILMQREWMQHHRGWLTLMLIPVGVFLLILPFGEVELDLHVPPMPLAAIALMATAAVVFMLSFAGAMFQLPGLARRDRQDRSIEFWLSLPASHSESIGATVLMHALLIPLLALAVGAALGLLSAVAMIIKVHGFASLAEPSWSSLMLAALVVLARGAVGVLLMTLWLAPLFMALMAASAWLKRWGVPVLIGGVLILGGVLKEVYDNAIVFDLLERQFQGAGSAMLGDPGGLRPLEHARPELSGEFVTLVGQWAWHDIQATLGQLFSAHFIGGLLLAAACFGLLVLKRRQGS
ncbi:hypothetical protein [Roseateles sp.]|jgi:ABC-2 type transport system permease protein|uniref:hypothetical protein n=1 Tax=Roseateles sp. TaxID=1971397 RepID=UPI0037CA31D6